jgi:hypothetical protein
MLMPVGPSNGGLRKPTPAREDLPTPGALSVTVPSVCHVTSRDDVDRPTIVRQIRRVETSTPLRFTDFVAPIARRADYRRSVTSTYRRAHAHAKFDAP